MERHMKILSMVIFAVLSGFSIQVFGEPEIFYPEGDERALPPPPLPSAAMRVVGEIRSVDENKQPRLWGEGRPGTERYGQLGVETDLCVNASGDVEFGLTNYIVEWASSPAVCPIGTWVCTYAEVSGIACDTARPDDLSDSRDCDHESVDKEPDAHIGWLADVYSMGDTDVWRQGKSERGHGTIMWYCNAYPVWCCSEYQP